METFTLFLLVFSVLVGAFIAKTMFFVFGFIRNEMLSKAWDTGRQVVNVVERAYRGRDYRASIRYSMESDMINRPYSWASFGNQQIFVNEDHKKHIVKELIYGMCEKIYEDGAVEIIDHNRNDTLPPWQREIDLRLKVYVPERDSSINLYRDPLTPVKRYMEQ